MFVLCLFVFECYGDQRDIHVLIHAFPTLRSSDLPQHAIRIARAPGQPSPALALPPSRVDDPSIRSWRTQQSPNARMANPPHSFEHEPVERSHERSEEHTSELQSLMRISYAVFCLKKKQQTSTNNIDTLQTY